MWPAHGRDHKTPALHQQCLAAIEHHSAALAEAARRDLSAPVRHCPDWDVTDLVWHLTGVHWFWARIAEERPTELPEHLIDEEHRPSRPADPDELLAGFESGARRLVEGLRSAEQDTACWTWAPEQQHVAFITRHQVQEGWHRLEDGQEPDDLAAPGTATVGGHADPADVLLWLYGRVRHPYVAGPDGDTDLLERLRALTFTD